MKTTKDLKEVFENFYKEFIKVYLDIEEEDKDAFLMNLLYSVLNGIYRKNTQRALIEMALRAIDQNEEERETEV